MLTTSMSLSKILSLLLFGLLLTLDESVAFAPLVVAPSSSTSTTRLNGLFGGLSDAFKNDDKLGKAKDAGLSSGPKYNENVSVNGKPVPGAVVGQKLTVVAGKVRVKIPVNCQAGDCGTCMVILNGRKVKACQTPLPSGKATIQTL